jgi:BASS family bile acid:Na+ symporter
MIIFIVTSVLIANQKQILESGAKLLFAVFLLHLIGFILGYIITFSITKDFILAKTISIEVGMQNSGLGVILANKNFSNPLTAVPAAISSFAHSMIASLLAWIWRR